MVADATGRQLRELMGLSLATAALCVAALPLPSVHAVTVEVTGSGPLTLAGSHEALPRRVPVVRHEPRQASGRHEGSTEGAAGGQHVNANHAAEPPPSRIDLLKRDNRPDVLGHVALPSMMEVSYGDQAGTMTFSCVQVFEKARNITQDYKAHRIAVNAADAAAAAPAGWVYVLEQKILAQTKSAETISEFARVLDDRDLGDGLMGGMVWTATDATVWADCNTGQSTVNATGADMLEVHASIDGVRTVQGDEVIATPSQAGMLLEAAVKHRRAAKNIWPVTTGNQHEIAYCFASSISTEAREAHEAAVRHIEQQVPCLKFKPVATSGGANAFSTAVPENCAQMPSIIVQSAKAGCWSYIGQVSNVGSAAGASQPINLGTGCEDMGIAAHEIGHAIGLLHEMSRNDRDKWVTIRRENIAEAMMNNFENTSAAEQSSDFDFLSLMMYGSYAFSTNGEVTVQPHDMRLVNYMGQRMGFSQLDIELIGNVYGCLNTVTPITPNKQLSKMYITPGGINTGFTGACKDSAVTGYVRTDDSPMPCTELRKYCAHDTLGAEVRQLCPVSCYMCIKGIGAAEVGMPTPVPGPAPLNSRAVGSRSPLWSAVCLALAALLAGMV